MKFINDNQRKAVFSRLNMNRFAAAPMAPIFRQIGIKSAVQDEFGPEEQTVMGYTGARMKVSPQEDILPMVITRESRPMAVPGETVILAGERFGKGYDDDSWKDFIKSEAEAAGVSEDAMRDYVEKAKSQLAADSERRLGKPVFSGAAELMSLKSLDDIKGEFLDIEDDKESRKFLRKYAKSKRSQIREWANEQLYGMHMDAKTAREEAMMEDPSKGADPDYFRSEEDMRWQAEQDYLADN